jgi:hypothetical protein
MIKRQLLFAITVAVAAGSCGTGSTDSAPTPTEPWGAARTLPIEVFWKNSEESIEVALSADAAASAVYFSTRLNNIDGPDRVAIGLNDSPYVSVNKATVETDGLGEGQDLAGDFKFPNTRDIRFKVAAGTLKGASCNDCHVDTSDATHDGGGYDLKYFNYSSHAIVSRAQFHQLSQTEGEDITAYIRSLPTPASKYGRPWNPPYQPGPEIYQRPASEWAAGAGIDAVLTDQSKLVPLLFPSGTISDADISLTSGKKIDLVSLPSFPLLDWNEWLPTVHPKDARRIFVAGQFDRSMMKGS